MPTNCRTEQTSSKNSPNIAQSTATPGLLQSGPVYVQSSRCMIAATIRGIFRNISSQFATVKDLFGLAF